MLTEYGVLKPDVPRAGYSEESYEFWRAPRRLREQREWKDFFARWREIPRPHDRLWRARLLSVQCVIDSRSLKTFDPQCGAHWLWGATSVLFWAATAFFALAGLIIGIR